MFMAEESNEKEAAAVEEPEEDETEATTTGLFIPGFSDQVEQTPEPPAKKKPEPPNKKEEPKQQVKEVVTKEEAISKAESVISEATKSSSGGGFNLSNPFANKSSDKVQPPKPPTPPAAPKAEKKLSDSDVSPVDLMKLVRGETTAKDVEEKAQQFQRSKMDLPFHLYLKSRCRFKNPNSQLLPHPLLTMIPSHPPSGEHSLEPHWVSTPTSPRTFCTTPTCLRLYLPPPWGYPLLRLPTRGPINPTLLVRFHPLSLVVPFVLSRTFSSRRWKIL
jgi:hypothetical protein